MSGERNIVTTSKITSCRTYKNFLFFYLNHSISMETYVKIDLSLKEFSSDSTELFSFFSKRAKSLPR